MPQFSITDTQTGMKRQYSKIPPYHLYNMQTHQCRNSGEGINISGRVHIWGNFNRRIDAFDRESDII